MEPTARTSSKQFPSAGQRTSALRRAREIFRLQLKRSGSYVGIVVWAIASICWYLVHYHEWPERWQIVPGPELPAVGFVVGLIFILSEQIKDYSESLERSTNVFGERVAELEGATANLIASLAPQLDLLRCVEKLQRILSIAPDSEVVSIRHLSLDMETAWLHIRDRLLDVKRRRRTLKVKYSLLMITGDYDQLAGVCPELQEEMKQMCARADARLATIKNYFDRPRAELDGLDLEIKT